MEFAATNIEIVELSATQSETHILADTIGSQLPTWLWRAAVYLLTKAFNAVRRERYLAKQIGSRIVREKMETARQGLEINNDLFSLLVGPDALKTLSEDDLVEQTAFILVAGQETTVDITREDRYNCSALTTLAILRGEINFFLGANARNVTYDNMPLLNAFIKEILRFYPAVPITDRIAVQDTVIPLGQSITTSTGERINQIPVPKAVAISSYQSLSL
ncbi:cytochrome P450 [Mycena leptocephala]|nr:cytochrome P450 [Mycena leptocephala]